jgi:hypothetical protein
MKPAAVLLPSPHFYRLGAACCLYYITAQFIQEITFRFGINDSATGENEIWQRLMPLDQFRAVLILLGFTLIPIITASAGVALRRYRIRPAASMLGFAFSALFVAAEMSVRSIDLFLVSRNWAVAHLGMDPIDDLPSCALGSLISINAWLAQLLTRSSEAPFRISISSGTAIRSRSF